MRLSLRKKLIGKLKTKRYLTVDEVAQIAESHGSKISNAERRLRNETNEEHLPIVKYNQKGKPIKKSEKIVGYGWKGSRTFFRKVTDFLEKKPRRKKQYA